MTIRDRVQELRRVRASELVPHPENWRVHGENQRSALRGALEEIGFADALLVREDNGRLQVIDGHLRREEMGDAEVPVLVLDVTEEEARKMLVTLDPLAGLADANQQALGELLASVETEQEGLREMLDGLAEEHDIDLFQDGAEELQDPEPQLDRAAELQKEWGTELGQLWDIPGKAGVHRVLCGDTTKVEWSFRADCSFADPPYNVGFQYESIDDSRPVEEFIEWCKRWLAKLPRPAFVTCGRQRLWWYAAGGIEEPTELLCWSKKNSMKRTSPIAHFDVWEPVLVFGKTKRRAGSNLFEAPICLADAKDSAHPCPKPLKLLERIIEAFCEKSILDPFLGSGTTIVACEQLGRIGYGIEIEPKYVAVTLQRLKDMALSPRLAGE